MAVAIIKAILITIEVLSSVLLVAVILVQKSKSQGVGMAFGGGMGESIFGAQMGNVLTKTTVILAIIFFANTTLLAMMYSSGREAERAGSERAAPVEVTPVDPEDLQEGPREAPEEAGESGPEIPGTGDVVIPEDMNLPEGTADTDGSETPLDIDTSEEPDSVK